MALFYVMSVTESYICNFTLLRFILNLNEECLAWSYRNATEMKIVSKIRTNSCDAVNCRINSVNAGKS